MTFKSFLKTFLHSIFIEIIILVAPLSFIYIKEKVRREIKSKN